MDKRLCEICVNFDEEMSDCMYEISYLCLVSNHKSFQLDQTKADKGEAKRIMGRDW